MVAMIRARTFCTLLLGVSIAVLVSACSSTTTAPQTTNPIRDTGAYPNINIVPTGETSQLSDDETAARKAALYGQAEAQRRDGESAQVYLARLRKLQKLGSTHAAAALAEIEASQ